ncbi:phosphotransferase [Corynebacterium uterequi]|uniref:Aminoglycoside phosphotransferase domain-containing protein n=1 Tax=Corynebacterium uterequi TaxID=1072256 RepID=A0A0G3HFQ3_9CORY|nr:phosphotransferase [Corynebacterium uterequi]AKK11600.1 hypothetical protein CUTER_08075 [Corynebacterium uterequi]
MSIADMLMGSRFYGAKSEAIDAVDVVDSRDTPAGLWAVVRVHHGTTSDLYQVLLDGDVDVLGQRATEYGQALAAGTPLGAGQLTGQAPIAGESGRVLTGEQSNTSLLFDSAMVKVFRRLEPGLSPDVELLSRLGDCPHVAPVRGWVTHTLGGQDYTLAMVQDFVHGGRDGWALALDYAARGESFAAEATALGRAMRAVHDALAREFGTKTVPGEEVASRLSGQARALATRVPQLKDYLPQVLDSYDELRGTDVSVQRIHGDLHLGQTLRTHQRYVLIDFEGEPARPLAERRRPDSPLRDVAGMVRSLDYAAHFNGTADTGWSAEATEALLAGYGVQPGPLLDAYLVDKALYEVDYEANNRPDWVRIPLGAVERIMSARA